MSSIIQLLPDHVANQIAAGEVVQRPASVVKELMENAVDAGATEIKLIVKDAGKTLIQVIDNGKGMSVTDARLCFERHATSKIRHAEDLFSLHTKGFRGEALASIAAVTHVEMKTRMEQEELGTHIIIEGSKFTHQDVAVLPRGTSFSIKNLFFNIPARRNFLKSDTVEFRHIVDEFERVAMAHANISFMLYHNGSEMFNLPSGNMRQRIVGIFGGKTNEKLVPVNETTEIVTINGFVTKPEFAKKNRGEQFFFVNNRFIKSPYLHHAVMAAYEGLLKDGTQPAYYLYLDVPPHTIDINIHPTKTEIKFDDEHALYAILRSAIKHSLGQFNIAPVLDFDRDANLDTPYNYEAKEATMPTVEVDRNFNPFVDESPSGGSFGGGSFGSSFSSSGGGRSLGGNVAAKASSGSSGNFAIPSFKKEYQPSWESLYIGTNPSNEEIAEINFESEEVTGSLFNDSDIEETTVYKTYQIHKKYIVSPIKSGMVIIDQKRAHQRILYEQFLRNITVQQASSQQLLFPLVLYYTPAEIALITDMQVSLVSTGFGFAEINSDHVIVDGLPVNVAESEVSILLEELINDMQQEVPDTSFSLSDRIAKSMARSLAVKTGTQLTEKEQETMVNTLFACKEPGVSPFNKPTFITMSVEDLDKRFAL